MKWRQTSDGEIYAKFPHGSYSIRSLTPFKWSLMYVNTSGSGGRVKTFPSMMAAQRYAENMEAGFPAENPLSTGESAGILLGAIAAIATIGYAVYAANKAPAPPPEIILAPVPPGTPITSTTTPPPVATTAPPVTTPASAPTPSWTQATDAAGHITFQPGTIYRISTPPIAGQTFSQFVIGLQSPADGTVRRNVWAPGDPLPSDWPAGDTDPTRWRAEMQWVGGVQAHTMPAGYLLYAWPLGAPPPAA